MIQALEIVVAFSAYAFVAALVFAAFPRRWIAESNRNDRALLASVWPLTFLIGISLALPIGLGVFLGRRVVRALSRPRIPHARVVRQRGDG